MKKQFLSLITASLMVSGASQINAMGNFDRIPEERTEYAEVASRLITTIKQGARRPDFRWVTIEASCEKKGEIFGIRLYYVGNLTDEIVFIPAVEPKEYEFVDDYLDRLCMQRQELLDHYCTLEVDGSTLVPLPDVKVAK